MSSINGLGSNSPIQKVVSNPIQKSLPSDGPAQISSRGDKVELSAANTYLKTLKANDVRVDKVAQIKAQIEAGTYETDDKLNVAADRLLDDLFE